MTSDFFPSFCSPSLKSALGGSARCMFIFNASPAEGNSEETRCTFKFASRMRNISLGAAKKNVDGSGLEEALAKARSEARANGSELGALKAEVEALRARAAGGKGAAEARALDLERKLAARDEEAGAAAEEVEALRDQLIATQQVASPPPPRPPQVLM